MLKIMKSIHNIGFLDELAYKKTLIHNLNPVVKLLVTLSYLVVVVSFDKYDVNGLIPFVIYPIVVLFFSEIPFSEIFKRFIIILPFIIGIGIFNPVLDKEVYNIAVGVRISAGWISFSSLILKSSLTIFAGLLLITTTGIEKIALALRRLFVPKVFVVQLLLTYRYISVLLDEVALVLKAYSLRAPMEKGVTLKVSGSLLGQLLLRTFDRANRVYIAMKLRGFNGEYFAPNDKISMGSILYMFIWITFFIIARFLNISEIIGQIVTEGLI